MWIGTSVQQTASLLYDQKNRRSLASMTSYNGILSVCGPVSFFFRQSVQIKNKYFRLRLSIIYIDIVGIIIYNNNKYFGLGRNNNVIYFLCIIRNYYSGLPFVVIVRRISCSTLIEECERIRISFPLFLTYHNDHALTRNKSVGTYTQLYKYKFEQTSISV